MGKVVTTSLVVERVAMVGGVVVTMCSLSPFDLSTGYVKISMSLLIF